MFEQTFKNIDNVLWKEAGCSSELDYTEQASWLLFLKYLDDLEQDKNTEAALDGKKYMHIRSRLPPIAPGKKAPVCYIDGCGALVVCRETRKVVPSLTALITVSSAW